MCLHSSTEASVLFTGTPTGFAGGLVLGLVWDELSVEYS